MIWIRVAKRMISVMRIVEPIILVQRMIDSLVLSNVTERWLIVHKAVNRVAIVDGYLSGICGTPIQGLVRMARIAGVQLHEEVG